MTEYLCHQHKHTKGDKEMQKTIDDAINETADKLVAVLQESGLPVSVLKLLLTNTLLSLQQVQPQAPQITPMEESDNAESES